MAQKIIIQRAKANKYRNHKTMRDNILFDSKREADRYFELKILQRSGIITELELQPRFLIEINGVKVCDYIGDFQYVRDGVTIIEDAKGVRTRDYILKRKLMLAVWGIKIKET